MKFGGTPPQDIPEGDLTAALPWAFGGPAGAASLRAVPEDFVVEEVLGYQPSGAGEHVVVCVRKRNLNTHDVADRLARLAGVRPAAVGYAGRKDKLAVTTQSFSVQLPGRADPDWTALDSADLTVLSALRHHRKIRRGALRGNRFFIRLRRLAADPIVLEDRLASIGARGLPNYFGAQRFGTGGQNLGRAAQLLAGRRRFDRNQFNILLSAVRGWLFNRVLAARVERLDWDRVVDGDVLQLDGTRRLFVPEVYDEEIRARATRLDVHATGPLPGAAARAPQAQAEAARVERAALDDTEFWLRGLCHAGLAADRRALRVRVQDLEWTREGGDLELSFGLAAGAYATSVLREAVTTGPG
ncbi:MAG: tRNA pseudouridine(13) synthase TruD [Gammaproteobacteria bacterium]